MQDINATGSTGQLNISCEFIVDNTTTLGYIALVHSNNDINYLVTENTNEGVVTNHLKGLRSENYTTLLYAISESGLPIQQAAGFPTNISIDGTDRVEGIFTFMVYNNNYYVMLTFRRA